MKKANPKVPFAVTEQYATATEVERRKAVQRLAEEFLSLKRHGTPLPNKRKA